MIRQAIETKILGSTTFRGARIKARAAAGSVTIYYDHGLSSEANHKAAARALASKFDWKHAGMMQGASASSDGYVFILID